MTDRALFIRKVSPDADPGAVSRVIAAAVQTVYSKTIRRVTPSNLDARSDEHGNIQPYAADDQEVLSHMFGIAEDDWERVL